MPSAPGSSSSNAGTSTARRGLSPFQDAVLDLGKHKDRGEECARLEIKPWERGYNELHLTNTCGDALVVLMFGCLDRVRTMQNFMPGTVSGWERLEHRVNLMPGKSRTLLAYLDKQHAGSTSQSRELNLKYMAFRIPVSRMQDTSSYFDAATQMVYAKEALLTLSNKAFAAPNIAGPNCKSVDLGRMWVEAGETARRGGPLGR